MFKVGRGRVDGGPAITDSYYPGMADDSLQYSHFTLLTHLTFCLVVFLTPLPQDLAACLIAGAS